MIYITGDTHGSTDISKLNTKNFPEGNNLTKDDYVIVLGDFGLVWDNSKTDLYWRKWLDSKPWTTLFIDGNHENFNLLYEFPMVDKLGGKLRQISESIYHIPRGEIIKIEDKTFFGFGGARSIDKVYRKENISWWKQEEPSKAEMDYGVSNLENVNFKVDYVLTHTCPNEILGWVINNNKTCDSTERYLSFIDFELICHKWFFGHFHKDKLDIKGKYNCLYKEIIKL